MLEKIPLTEIGNTGPFAAACGKNCTQTFYPPNSPYSQLFLPEGTIFFVPFQNKILQLLNPVCKISKNWGWS